MGGARRKPPRIPSVSRCMLPCRARRLLASTALLLASLLLGGCSGFYHANAIIGPDLQPHVTTGVSIPFGK